MPVAGRALVKGKKQMLCLLQVHNILEDMGVKSIQLMVSHLAMQSWPSRVQMQVSALLERCVSVVCSTYCQMRSAIALTGVACRADQQPAEAESAGSVEGEGHKPDTLSRPGSGALLVLVSNPDMQTLQFEGATVCRMTQRQRVSGTWPAPEFATSKVVVVQAIAAVYLARQTFAGGRCHVLLWALTMKAGWHLCAGIQSGLPVSKGDAHVA